MRICHRRSADLTRFTATLTMLALIGAAAAAAQTIVVTRGGSRAIGTGSATNFTGDVRVDMLFESMCCSAMCGGALSYRRATAVWSPSRSSSRRASRRSLRVTWAARSTTAYSHARRPVFWRTWPSTAAGRAPSQRSRSTIRSIGITLMTAMVKDGSVRAAVARAPRA